MNISNPIETHPGWTVTSVLKTGIWVYLLLLLFEGALRKWVLPGLADPLLVVRDPVAIGLLLYAFYHGVMRWNGYLLAMTLIAFVAVPAALVFGHGSLSVTLFGARYLLIHFPFIFLIGQVFNREDVRSFGRFILWITPPMALLITLQFYSPQSAWINRGLGGNELGSGFSGALGYFRPSGIFSFTSGVSTFFSLAAAYVVYFWLRPERVGRLLLMAASVGVLIAIPMSISRAYLFQFVITVAFGLMTTWTSPAALLRIGAAAVIMVLAFVGLRQFEFFQTSSDVLAARYEGAAETEGGLRGTLGNRFLGEMYNSLAEAPEAPPLGYGLGAGTNTGQRLLAGQRAEAFISTEGEWNRIISEVGPFLGLAIVGLRLILGGSLLLSSWRLVNRGILLPWLLMSLGFLQITIGNWAQPTSLGFSVMMGGLVWAACRQSDD